jgi:hypothetical protein
MRIKVERKAGGIMPHIPYGYKIVDGKAVIDEEQAARVRTLFEGYISGLALKTAAEKAGLQIFHGSAGRMLRNTHYLGDEYYPAIIEKELFDIRLKKYALQEQESLAGFGNWRKSPM